MNVYVGNRLPSTYQEVEYIQSSGTQYIDTGVTVQSQGRVFQIKYLFPRSTSNATLFGILRSGYENDTHTRYSRLNNELEWDCYSGRGYGRIVYSKNNSEAIEEIELGNNYIKDLTTGTTLVTGTASNKTDNNTIPVFGNINLTTSQRQLSSFKLYYFKIIDNGTAIRDFVPCYRKSDGVIGLYDLVNNQFYTNSGTGTFSKGSDVVLCELKNAYIGNGLS